MTRPGGVPRGVPRGVSGVVSGGGQTSRAGGASMTRRGFLRASVAAGGGLLIGVSLPGCGDRATGDGAGSAKDGEEFAPNAFLRIDGDGTVTITVQRPEIGQGVRTALAMIVAEELEADWRSVKVEQANLDERLYGEQYAGGSDSVQYSWDLLRRAGATARELLVQAASEEWGVSGAECEARDGRVLHGPSGRSLGYGPLAVLAARGLSEEMPDAETLVATEPALKTPGEYRLIGRRTPSLDGAEVVTGRIRFGLDTRVEDMLVATVARCPVFGGRVQGFDAAAAEAVPGVRAVVEIDADAVEDFGPNNPKMANGVAVVAESTWAAMKGRDALRIDWDPGPGAAESTEGFWRECERLAGEPAQARIRDDGDFESAMTRAARRVEATYRVPYLAHTPMEPMNAVAHVTDGRCDVWAPCQNPGYVGTAAGKVTGLPPEAVHVHVVRSGGGFGRRFYADYAAEAVYLSRAVGAPVQVVWSREDDVRHGFYRPAGHHVLTAGLDAAGRPVAWRHFLANASRHAALGRGGDPQEAGELDDFDFPAGLLPNLRFEYSQLDSVVPRGQWRAVEPVQHGTSAPGVRARRREGGLGASASARRRGRHRGQLLEFLVCGPRRRGLRASGRPRAGRAGGERRRLRHGREPERGRGPGGGLHRLRAHRGPVWRDHDPGGACGSRQFRRLSGPPHR
ncbi:MAG: molybdopterin-dependent oxidoreductase [Gemmatimonadales bacterium]